jgi:hypothetical protein|tara:strand:- start:391 stop:969 length:579 start_codon:yes stop_codon:yes gene_type:complete
METNLENITNAYNKYISLLRKFFPDSHEGIERLEADVGERLALCPRDLHPEKGGTPGGLVAFSLMTAKQCKAFSSMVNAKKIARVALVHELGRLGDPELGMDLYVSEESDWHREKLGRHYKYNENCPKMSVAHRTLFYLATYGLHVDREEWISIATSSGFQYDENRFYANEVLPLAQSLQTARTFALMKTKG